MKCATGLAIDICLNVRKGGLALAVRKPYTTLKIPKGYDMVEIYIQGTMEGAMQIVFKEGKRGR